MIKGKTKSGFEYEVDTERLGDDWKFLEIIEKVATGEEYRTPTMLELGLGKEQKERLIKHIEDKNGYVSTTKMMEEWDEIMKGSQETKNS